jgi:hypothetical protein
VTALLNLWTRFRHRYLRFEAPDSRTSGRTRLVCATADRGALNAQIWMASSVIVIQLMAVQIGGTACGSQEQG